MRAQRSREFTDVEHGRAALAEGGEDTVDLAGIEPDTKRSHPTQKLRPVDVAGLVPCLEDGHNPLPLLVEQLIEQIIMASMVHVVLSVLGPRPPARLLSIRFTAHGLTRQDLHECVFCLVKKFICVVHTTDKFLPGGSSVVTTCCLSQQHALDGARTAACSHSTALPCLHALTPSSDWQVKEGHDSTVRPKMLVFEFDGGRKYIDEWAADGKPSLTRAQMRRVQSWKILAAVIVPPILLMIDYGHGETFTSPFQRRFGRWWHHFCALDSVDVAKAYSGGWRPDPSIDPATKFSRYL